MSKASDDELPELILKPIGKIRSELKTTLRESISVDPHSKEYAEQVRAYHQAAKDLECELIVFPEWEELLDGIEEYSHLLVLYWPHLLEADQRKLKKVHPMGRKDLPEKGVFATCSPARPNPVLVTAVRLLKRKGNVLRVKGLESLDGSPLIDIKPYASRYIGVENPLVPSWMEQV